MPFRAIDPPGQNREEGGFSGAVHWPGLEAGLGLSEMSAVKLTGVMPVLAVVHDLSYIHRLRQAIPGEGNGVSLNICRNAPEAILYLRGVGVYKNRANYPLPHVLLLDTGSPGAADLEVLEFLRNNGPFMQMPVVLLARGAGPERLNMDENGFLVRRDSMGELKALLDSVREVKMFGNQSADLQFADRFAFTASSW